MRIGLKVRVSDLHYIMPADVFLKRGLFDYIELFVDANSCIEDALNWKTLGCAVHLHAPHSYAGCNFAFAKDEDVNRGHMRKMNEFQRALMPEVVIFHPGINGRLDETIRQFSLFRREFPELFRLAVVENKPYFGLNGEICLGASPEEVWRVLKETGMRFCLDFGHAICYAAAFGKVWKEVINSFLKFTPNVFHISDGDAADVKDQHKHLGHGNYNFEWILCRLSKDSALTIETKKDSETDLNDFEQDVIYLRKIVL